jgi:hypothetical protein
MRKKKRQIKGISKVGFIKRLSQETMLAMHSETVNTTLSAKQKKLAAFLQLTQEVNDLARTDPLPTEFDEILSQRVRFRELADT